MTWRQLYNNFLFANISLFDVPYKLDPNPLMQNFANRPIINVESQCTDLFFINNQKSGRAICGLASSSSMCWALAAAARLFLYFPWLWVCWCLLSLNNHPQCAPFEENRKFWGKWVHENGMYLAMHSSDPSWKFHGLWFSFSNHFIIFSLLVMCLADVSIEKNFIYTVFLCRGKSMCVKAVVFHKKK